MKIYGVLTLLAIQGAFGFAPNYNAAKRATALFSTQAPANVGAVAATSPGLAPQGALEKFASKWDDLAETRIQGGALRTWSFNTMSMERVMVALVTEGPKEGNPLKVDISLNEGPDNTPQRCVVYSGKAALRRYKMWINTPSDTAAVFIRSKQPLEFPCLAKVGNELDDLPPTENMDALTDSIFDMKKPDIIQGAGALRSYSLDHTVCSVKVELKTDGRPLNAMVELVQGPNAPKYTIDIYSEDGLLRPFTAILETPGSGNEVRIVNTASMEFPLTASVGRSTEWENNPYNK